MKDDNLIKTNISHSHNVNIKEVKTYLAKDIMKNKIDSS